MFIRQMTLFLLWEMQQERLSSGVKAIVSTVAGLVPSLSFHLQRTQEACWHSMGGELTALCRENGKGKDMCL